MIPFLALQASEFDAKDIPQEQITLVSRLLSLAPSSKMNVCTLHGFSCDDADIARKLRLETAYPGLQIEWLPPTITEVTLSNQAIDGPIDARRLPRELEFLTARNCGIRGTFDLRKLPRHVLSIVLAQNSISGNLFLLRLPANLRIVDFRANPIRFVFVQFHSLPEKFNCASLTEKHKGVRMVIKSLDSSDSVPPVFHIYTHGVYGTSYVYTGQKE